MPCPPTGIVSKYSSKLAINGLPREIASFTDGNDNEALWLAWLSQTSVTQIAFASAGSSDYIAQTAWHVRNALQQDGNQGIALSRDSFYLADQAVHRSFSNVRSTSGQDQSKNSCHCCCNKFTSAPRHHKPPND